MKSSRPCHSIRINNYKEFREDIQRFAEGKHNALIVLGNTGIGKSEAIRKALSHKLIYEGGEPSAFQFYCDLYEHRDGFVILDDVSPKFFMDHNTNSYLKILTNTVLRKTMGWPTSKLGPSSDPPNHFETQSRVVILTNEWKSINEHVRAIEGRFFSIRFEPDATEVHLEIARGGWFYDQEVYDFIWSYLPLITKPDMRYYVKIAEQKQAGAHWRKRGLEMLIGDERMQRVAELLEDQALSSNKQRAIEFVSRGYGARSTFYECLKHFENYRTQKLDQCPQLVLKQPPQPENLSASIETPRNGQSAAANVSANAGWQKPVFKIIRPDVQA